MYDEQQRTAKLFCPFLQPLSAMSIGNNRGRRWTQEEFDEHYLQHKRRLKAVTASIDCKPPTVYPHIELKLKKLQLEDQRIASITTENTNIIKRLVGIMENPGRIDCYNDHYDEHKSSNEQKRKDKALEIVRENEAIVNRLVMVKPRYNRKVLESCWEDHEEVLKRMGKYHHPWRNVPKTKQK